MRQLFWRLNIQQYRNVKYKQNKDMKNKMKALKGTGLGRDIRKDTDAVDDAFPSRDVAETPGTARYAVALLYFHPYCLSKRLCRSSTFHSITDPSFGVDTNVIDSALHEAPSNLSKERETSEDPYQVPDTPDVRIPSPLVSYPGSVLTIPGIRQVF